MDLSHKLERVCRNHLFGQAVPAELRLLWQLKTNSNRAPHLEVLYAVLGDRLHLLDLRSMDEHPLFFERYSRQAMLERCEAEGISPGPFEPRYKAYEDVVAAIAFFAIDHQERFIGYWLGRAGDIPVAQAPLATLDPQGVFQICSAPLIDFLADEVLADHPDAAASLRRHAQSQMGTLATAPAAQRIDLSAFTAHHGDPQGVFRERVLQRTARLKTIAID